MEDKWRHEIARIKEDMLVLVNELPAAPEHEAQKAQITEFCRRPLPARLEPESQEPELM